jgi:hypothetical protein
VREQPSPFLYGEDKWFSAFNLAAFRTEWEYSGIEHPTEPQRSMFG